MEKAPVKVARVIARLNVGGPAIHVLNLGRGMSARYPTLLLAGEVDDDEADLTDQVSVEGVNLIRVPELGRRISLWQDAVALAKLYRLFRKTRPTIVHTHTAKAGTLGRIAAVMARVPVRIHTFHGHVMRGYFSPWLTRIVIGVEKILASVTTCFITVSESQARELTEDLRICPPERMRVVPLGFDLTRFDPEALAAVRGEFAREIDAGGRPVVTIVGRLVKIKNHDLLLRAAKTLRQTGRSFVLAIVGGGPEEDRLRARTEAMGIADSVRFLGWRSDLDRIYADSTVVALTSINEGTPVCLIEALAAGCPVVSTDVGGVRDVLENGRLGLIVDNAEPEAIAAAIEKLLEDRELRERVGKEGSIAMRSRFGVDRLLRDMTSLYDELLDADGHTEPQFMSSAQATSCTT